MVLQTDDDLARLKESVGMLGGETLLEGWAADSERSGERVPGLVLVTNYRVIFIDVGGVLSAFPIAKIHSVEVHSPIKISISAWYGRLVLTFDNPGTSSAVLNLLRQDSNWNAVDVNLARQLARASPKDDGEAETAVLLFG